MGSVIGIDLGTGNSCVSVISGGKPMVVTNSEGGRTTPSVVSLKGGERKIGQSASRQRVVFPEETVYNIKRFMGNTYEQCSEVISRVPYKVENIEGLPRVNVEGRRYSPEEISSFILAKMKQTAEDYLGETVTDAVITCPAWFDNSARQATKMAGTLCGLNVLRVINEPTAAILASDIVRGSGNMKVMVADIGQGTTDFSVCDISEGLVEVLASKGDVFLGGSDWDNAIAKWLIEDFKETNGIDLYEDRPALSRILEEAEKAKIELSSSTVTDINLPYITALNGKPLHLNATLTRARMEQLTAHLVDRVVACAREAIVAAKINASELKYILLVGGQSRSLALQEALTNAFGVELNKSVNPDEAVSLGAAIQANIIVGGEGAKDILLLDVTPLTLGIETLGGVMTPLVEANTTIPCAKSETFTTAVDNQSSVEIKVLQGARPIAKDNKTIGRFVLDGIAPARRGIPQIEVKFDIDANGILSVSATDKATGKEQNITIKDSGSISDEEITRIKKEAETYAEADAKAKAELERANRCEGYIYQMEAMVENYKDNPSMTENDKSFTNEKIELLKSLAEKKDYDGFDKVEKELNERWQVIAARAYKSEDNGKDAASNPFGDIFNKASDLDSDDVEEQTAK